MRNIKTLSIYGISHLLVDAICIGGILSINEIQKLKVEHFIFFVLLYNIIAFAGQMFIGYWCDEIRKPKQLAILGILLCLIGLVILKLPLLAAITLGIGNGLFHVGGGVISFYITPNKATAPGIFVAPGAIGVFIGAIISKTTLGLAITSLILVIMIYFIFRDNFGNTIIYENKYPNINNKFIYLIMSLLFVICVRAIIGGSIVYPWKMDIIDKGLIVFFVVLGKALGGILGDRYGLIRIGIGGLLISSILLTIGNVNMFLGLLGIFSFNLTMPITLTLLANGFKRYKGLAFGLTTTALVLGFIIDYIMKPFYLGNIVITFILIILSAIALKYGSKLKESS